MAQIAIIILLLIGVHFCQFRYPFISIFEVKNNSETRHTGYVLDYRTTTAIKGLSMLLSLLVTSPERSVRSFIPHSLQLAFFYSCFCRDLGYVNHKERMG